MRLTEEQIKILKEAAEKVTPTNDTLYQQAQQNPEFKKAQDKVANGPLVHPSQMKQFITGLAALNNPKALNGLFKKTKVYGKKGDKDVAGVLSTGMQLFTQTLGNVSAATALTAAGQAKKALTKKGKVTEQTEGSGDVSKALKRLTDVQKNAAAYLMMNRISKKDMTRINNPEEPLTGKNDPFNIPHKFAGGDEKKIRNEIRNRVKKIINGK